MVIRDVNNYSSIDTKGVIKRKGLFEIEKELHKDASFRIIPIALEKYFYEGTPIKDTLLKEKDIFKFCGWFRATKGWQLYSEDIYTGKQEILPKSNRYYVSKEGSFFFKRNLEDKREQFVDSCKGVLITFFNTFYQSEDYNIDYNFYLSECTKIIKSVTPKQLNEQIKLF